MNDTHFYKILALLEKKIPDHLRALYKQWIEDSAGCDLYSFWQDVYPADAPEWIDQEEIKKRELADLLQYVHESASMIKYLEIEQRKLENLKLVLSEILDH